jgi:hypothetical protein
MSGLRLRQHLIRVTWGLPFDEKARVWDFGDFELEEGGRREHGWVVEEVSKQWW